MAKSSRSSRLKKNNQGLKKRVFGPVEAARSERLSAKLLALAQQPKPPRAEMEVENDGKPGKNRVASVCADHVCTADSKDADAEAKEEQQAVGTLPSLSISIPPSLLIFEQLPTPPDTPPLDATSAFPNLERPAQKALAKELLFYHLLGASTDILGFDDNGGLQLGFARDGE